MIELIRQLFMKTYFVILVDKDRKTEKRYFMRGWTAWQVFKQASDTAEKSSLSVYDIRPIK